MSALATQAPSTSGSASVQRLSVEKLQDQDSDHQSAAFGNGGRAIALLRVQVARQIASDA